MISSFKFRQIAETLPFIVNFPQTHNTHPSRFPCSKLSETVCLPQFSILNLKYNVFISKDSYEKMIDIINSSVESLDIDETLIDCKPIREYLAFACPSNGTKAAINTFRNRTPLVKIANN